MPIVTLYENSQTQLNFFNKPYLFQIKKVEISAAKINEESSYLLEENNLLTTTFCMRSRKAYDEFINYAMHDYINLKSLPSYKVNDLKNSISIQGDCKDFILYLGLNNYMSKELNEKIIDVFNDIEDKSLLKNKEQKAKSASCSIM